MVQALQAFLKFCYIVQHDILDTNCLQELEDALECYHTYHQIFQECGVHPEGFNLPWQHLLLHCFQLIRDFGAPNGLCSSITKLKHIKAVKEPWWHSSHFNTLSQMLLTNQRLDKLVAVHVDFTQHGMFQWTHLDWALSRLCASPYHDHLIQ